MILKIQDVIKTTKYARRTPIVERFWKKVVRRSKNTCWPWIGSKKKDGYGVFQIGQKKQYLAHRISFLLNRGFIDSQLLVRHSCDNPNCVNPHHLLQGTPVDNMQDAVARKRIAFGERANKSTLTDEEVRTIRAEYIPRMVSLASLGKKYSVSHVAINNIVKRNTWRHVA